MRVSFQFKLIIALLLGFGFAGFLPIPDYVMLNGVSTAPATPRFTWESIQNRDTMRAFEEWFNRKLALRWLWVGIDRQLTYGLFRELPRTASGSLILAGPDDWLFEEQYLSTALRGGNWDEKTCKSYAEQISRIQRGLARQGIAFALVVAPSKVEVYPEYLPSDVKRLMEKRTTETNFNRLRPFLEASSIQFFDGPKRFAEWKKSGETNLFARSGTHWSYHAAAKVLQELRPLLNSGLKVPFPGFSAVDQSPAPPAIDDRDLLKTSNLLFPDLYDHAIIRPKIVRSPEVAGTRTPRILWIHDSFGWQILELIYEGRLAEPSESLFYFRSGVQNPGRIPTATVTASLDWSSYLRDFDAVVLLHTEIATDERLWGAVDSLDTFFREGDRHPLAPGSH